MQSVSNYRIARFCDKRMKNPLGSGDRRLDGIPGLDRLGSLRLLLAAVVLVVGLTAESCQSRPGQAKAVGEAFVGPMSLHLREELAQRAAVTATVEHGERLAILATHRRFVKVRAADGSEGWTDSRLLLNEGQMRRLRTLAERAAAMPSQGRATPFDDLNVHTEANRQSPSFYQLQEGETADVLAQRVMPRIPYTGEALPARPAREDPQGNPLPLDDWMLLRLADGRAGWVLSRAIMMAIPDEVTQYAEGHYITSYFALGGVAAGEDAKKNWLWTTRATSLLDYDFDSVRVFAYSQRRKRYETVFIERNLTGYYPVEVEQDGAEYRFRVICAGKDGVVERRTYGFSGQRVRLLEREPYQLTEPGEANSPAEALLGESQPGFLERAWRRIWGN